MRRSVKNCFAKVTEPSGWPRRRRPVVTSTLVGTGLALTREVDLEYFEIAASMESAMEAPYLLRILGSPDVPFVEVMIRVLS